MFLRKISLAGAVSLLATGAAIAGSHGCTNDVPIKTLTNAFPAYEVMTNAMQACGNVESELDKDHQDKLHAAFAANPSLYQIASATNSSSISIIDAQLVRPLDDLIAEFGADLSDNQKIVINGQTLAIGALVNTQHLMYREDILADLGIAVPTTWDEYIAAAEKIQAAGVVDNPIGHYFIPGFNLSFVFVNHYLGEGGDFFNDDWTPSINNVHGIAVLERMAKLASLMDPEYLTSDSTFMTKQMQQGKVAMVNLWASRAGAVNDPAESQFAGKIKMAAGLMGSERIASTLWWDGWVIAKNTSDEEAEAGFKLIVASMADDVIAAHNDDAIWLASGFKPGEAAAGAAATANGGAVPFPASKHLSALMNELGSGLAAYLTGAKDAATTLADIEAAYITSAKEAGLL